MKLSEQLRYIATEAALRVEIGTSVTVEALIATVSDLAARAERIEAENETLRRIPKDEVWYWGDDEYDKPESLGMPAIVPAHVIRRMAASERYWRFVKKRLKPVDFGWDFNLSAHLDGWIHFRPESAIDATLKTMETHEAETRRT